MNPMIYCDSEEPQPIIAENVKTTCYGYDVSSLTADNWSVVGDFSRSPWATKYLSMLNENGLFSMRDTAEQYLHDYRTNDDWDADSPFVVVRVEKVL